MTVSCGPVTETLTTHAGATLLLLTCACRKVGGTALLDDLRTDDPTLYAAKRNNLEQSFAREHARVMGERA